MQKRVAKKTLISILLLLILSFIFFYPFQTALVFNKENSNQIVAYLPVEEGDSFQIIYTHSIHLSDVVEKYMVMPDDSIKQQETIYENYGIGMPSNDAGGGTFVYEDGKYHIKDMNRIFPSIHLRNGKVVSKHRLVWGEQGEHMVWFNDYFEPGARFTMKVDQLSLWKYMRGVKIHD